MLKYLKEGVPLHTLNPSALTNAVYVASDEMGWHEVVSDFGNKLHMSTEDLLQSYKLPDWYCEYLALDFPFETLRERWTLQIELLTKHLADLK